MTNSRGPI